MHPVITVQPVSVMNCGTGYVTFSVTAVGNTGISTPVNYQWLENGIPITNGSTANGDYSGATSNTLTITSPTPTLNGKLYTCIVSQCNSDTTLAVTITVSNTNDNNVCTTDFCDPVTGALSHTPLAGIDDNNACTSDVCNSVSGNISHAAVNTNDNDACTTDGCSTVTGIYHTSGNISDNNFCTDDFCNSISGSVTHTSVTIDDNDACTIDACVSSTGVITNIAIFIGDNDVCTFDACDVVTGSVSHAPVNASDNNGCTTDGCNSITGIYHITINIDDNNSCTFDYCNPLTGVISHPAVNINDNDVCTTDGCNSLTGIFHTSPNINDNDPCTADICNSLTGSITHDVYNTNDNNSCTTDGCNPVTGVYHIFPNINDNDTCTADACNSISGSITHLDITPPAPIVSVADNCGYSVLTASGYTGSLYWSNVTTLPSFTVQLPGTFSVTQTINGCTSSSDSGSALPKISPVVFLGLDVTLPAGSFLPLDAGSGFTDYLWSTGETTQGISVQISNSYSVTVTAQNGCTASDTITVNFVTGIQEVVSYDDIRIFPNPCSNSIFFKLDKQEKIYQIEIYNSIGQKQKVEISSNIAKHTTEINTSFLSEGIYSILIFTNISRRAGLFVKQ